MLHELFLTTRQKTKIRNVFAKNMSTSIKLSKTQMSRQNQSSGFFGSWLSNLGKKALRNLAVPFARDNYNSNAINKFEREITEKSGVSAGKESTNIWAILLKW